MLAVNVEPVLEELEVARLVTVDTETKSLQPWRDGKIMIGLCVKALGGTPFYLPFRHEDCVGKQVSARDMKRVLKALLGRTIILHNAKFDMAVLYQEGLDLTWEDIVCTMVMARLCSENRVSYELDRLAADLVDPSAGTYKKEMRQLVKKAGYAHYGFVPPEAMEPYGCKDLTNTEGLYRYFRPIITERKLDDLFALEKRVTRVLFDMECRGVKMDMDYVRTEERRTGDLLDSLLQQLHDSLGYDLDIDSPAKVGAAMTQLGVQAVVKTPKGKDSWSKVSLANTDHPSAQLIVMARAVKKIKTSYYVNFQHRVDAEDALHANINQAGARTGRMSCREPNLQNIPRFEAFTGARVGAMAEGVKRKRREEAAAKQKAAGAASRQGAQEIGDTLFDAEISEVEEELFGKVRGSFVARPGHILLLPDWSQVELRIFATYANEKDLLKVFDYGLDVHRMTALAAYGSMPFEKGTQEYLWFRNMGKGFAFGLLYGMGIKAIALQLGRSEEEAQGFWNMYFARFRNGWAFIEAVKAMVCSRGYLRNKCGRRRYLDATKAYIGVNFLVQGTAADLMKDALVRVWERCKRERLGTQPLIPVHDEIILEVPYAEAEYAVQLCTEEMTKFEYMPVPLKVDFAWSPTSWGEKQDMDCKPCEGSGKILNIDQDELLKALYTGDPDALKDIEVKTCEKCNGSALDLSKMQEYVAKAA